MGSRTFPEMLIRHEIDSDWSSVRVVNLSAFDSPLEADLVDMLRADIVATTSLVAVLDATVVGHIMFSSVELDGSPDLHLMGLAPMAVAPSHQRRGVGSKLVREGLEQCRLNGVAAVCVLGHPTYYPRFGFRPASEFGIRCGYEVPPEAFMLQVLQDGGLAGRSGTIRYSRCFDAL